MSPFSLLSVPATDHTANWTIGIRSITLQVIMGKKFNFAKTVVPPMVPTAGRPSAMLANCGVLVGLIALLLAWIYFSPSDNREAANRVKCSGKLRTIGQALIAYVADRGRYPAKLEDMIGTGHLHDPSDLVCPSAPDQLHPSYIYRSGGLAGPAKEETVIVLESSENHRGDGINVLFADGSVEFFGKSTAELIPGLLNFAPGSAPPTIPAITGLHGPGILGQLHDIGTALRRYARDHEQHYPNRLDELITDGYLIFSADWPNVGFLSSDAAIVKLNRLRISFVQIGEPYRPDPNIVVAYQHDGEYCILFGNGESKVLHGDQDVARFGLSPSSPTTQGQKQGARQGERIFRHEFLMFGFWPGALALSWW